MSLHPDDDRYSADCSDLFEDADDPESCKCRNVVLQAYDNLTALGMPRTQVIDAATTILRHHHSCSSVTAKTIVECWVHKHVNAHVH